jgi:hypothetical protein
MTDCLELCECGYIHFASAFSQVIRFVLTPPFTQVPFLRLAEPKLFHLTLHGDLTLVARRGVTKEREVQILKVDARCYRFL